MTRSTSLGKKRVFRGQHAVVIGGSIAGLLAARALADYFEQVTLIERDRFPRGVELRKGVPQARHVYALLSKGMVIMQEFFPNLFPQLLSRGSVCLDTALDMEGYQHHLWKVKMQSGIEDRPAASPYDLSTAVHTKVDPSHKQADRYPQW